MRYRTSKGITAHHPGRNIGESGAVICRRKVRRGESFVHESIIGSLFECTVAEVCDVNGVQAIKPIVSGNAAICGFATWILDPKDPFPEGFLLI